MTTPQYNVNTPYESSPRPSITQEKKGDMDALTLGEEEPRDLMKARKFNELRKNNQLEQHAAQLFAEATLPQHLVYITLRNLQGVRRTKNSIPNFFFEFEATSYVGRCWLHRVARMVFGSCGEITRSTCLFRFLFVEVGESWKVISFNWA